MDVELALGYLFFTLAICTIVIMFATMYYSSKREKRMEERVRLTKEWEEKEPTPLLAFAFMSVYSALIFVILIGLLSLEWGWSLVNALLFAFILLGSFLLLMWFQEVNSALHIYHFKWKRVDEPFEYVVENVEGIFKARGIPSERFDLEGYIKGGGNQKMRRHLYWSASKGPRYGVYELGMNEPIIQLNEVSGDDQDRTLITLYYLRERDDPLIDHLTHDIDRLLGLESL